MKGIKRNFLKYIFIIESKFSEVFFYLDNLKFFPREYNNNILDIQPIIVIKEYI